MFRAIGRVLKDERGAIQSVELIVLSFPILFVTLALIQQAWIAQAVIVTEYAAQASARSALVHSCRPLTRDTISTGSLGKFKTIWASVNCTKPATEDGSKPWETAARLAIMAIAPSSEFAARRQQTCAYPRAAIAMAVRGPVQPRLHEALHHKACYAFEPENLKVDLVFLSGLGPINLASSMPPIRATVTYKMPIYGPVAGLFRSGTRSDGTHYRTIKATAEIL